MTATCKAVMTFRCKRPQAFFRAILQELWHWGCQCSEQEQGSRGAQWIFWVEAWLGLASPQCPHQSKEQDERRNILQE